MDVEIRAAENVTHHETGRTEADTATLEGSRASEVTLTWLYLQFDAPATVTLAGPVTMATSAADLSWDGAARFTPTNGSLRTPEGTYSTVGGPAKLDGRFTGRLAPLAGEQGRLEVAGEVRSASLRYEPAPLAPGAGSGGFPWGVVLLVGAAVVAVGTGGFATRAILVRRRRTTRPVPAASAPFPFTAEDCLRASHLLLEQDDYPGALEWATRARTLAPTSGEAVSHEAYCLECIGDAEGAMRAYAEAARLMPEDGDMPFLAALQARDVPGHSREAEDWLQRALAKQPANAWDAENAFPHLARNPEWRRIFREAKERAARAGEENEGGPKA
jgi:tetratricopeptide (TPR) repeat protein